jgi:hypothetical protein
MASLRSELLRRELESIGISKAESRPADGVLLDSTTPEPASRSRSGGKRYGCAYLGVLQKKDVAEKRVTAICGSGGTIPRALSHTQEWQIAARGICRSSFAPYFWTLGSSGYSTPC